MYNVSFPSVNVVLEKEYIWKYFVFHNEGNEYHVHFLRYDTLMCAIAAHSCFSLVHYTCSPEVLELSVNYPYYIIALGFCYMV